MIDNCRYPEDENCDCPDCRAYLQEKADEFRYAGDARHDLMFGADSDYGDWYIE